MALKKKEKKQKEPKEQKPYFIDEGNAFESNKKKAGLTVVLILLSAVLGFLAGFIIWGAFVGSMVLTNLLWVDGVETWQAALDQTSIGGWWLPLFVTTIGGLIIGIWTKFTQAMPIPMEEVLAEVKKKGKFGFRRPFATIIGFLLPLVLGGAIGPEAGLTGLTAHACSAIGGGLRRRGIKMGGLADISISAAMAGMFGNPLVGIVASASDGIQTEDIQSEDEAEGNASGTKSASDASSTKNAQFDVFDYDMKRQAKLVLYTISALCSALGAYVFSNITGASFGFPRFEGVLPGSGQWWWIIPCLAVGFLGAFLYQTSKFSFIKLNNKMGDRPILKPLLCGIILGAMALVCPMVLFPGEEQLFELQESWQTWTAALLFATGLLKCIAAPMCLNMGWNGGGIFPLIYSGAALGYAMSMISGVDPMFCVALTTAILIAGTQRKLPISIAFLLLAFPPSTILFMLAAVVLGVIIPMPKAFFPEAQPKKNILKKKKDKAAEAEAETLEAESATTPEAVAEVETVAAE